MVIATIGCVTVAAKKPMESLVSTRDIVIALNRGERRTLKFSKNKDNIALFENLLKNLNLGLEQKLHTEMGVLSGGQRQAIALLMATMKAPELILLDEHTAALDPKTQKKIMLLSEEKVKEKNLTALMITHNLQDALTYGNRMLLLHQGEIVRDFSEEEKKKLSVTDLLNSARTLVTLALVECQSWEVQIRLWLTLMNNILFIFIGNYAIL